MNKLIQVFFIITFFHLCACQSHTEEKSEQPATQEAKTDSVVTKEIVAQSEITCPECGHKKTETLPTEVCQLSYTCENCKTVLHPKDDDCCVFCSYGDHKCPSMQ